MNGAAQVIHVVPDREDKDCALVALAMYLGHSYEDVLRAAAVLDRQQGRQGLGTRTLQRIAKRLGHKLVVRRGFDWDEAYGILRLPDHAAVLRNGLVINTDSTIWEVEAFLAARRFEPMDCFLLIVAE